MEDSKGKSLTPGGDSLYAGGTTSGGESGGSPITVLRMKMEDGVERADGEMVPISTQTEQPVNEDKETMMTREEVEENEATNTECRETQV